MKPQPRRTSDQFLIERRNLLDQLATIVDYKLTLIIAPPGYGKTTLINQFRQQSDLPFAWQALDNHDQDVPNLYDGSIKVLSTLAPALNNLNPAGGTSPSELATLITDSLKVNVKTDFVYVIDDVHYAMESPGAKAWLKALISTLPGKCHLILMGHALPPLGLTEKFARRQILSIGQEDLAFSPQEVDALAQRVKATLTTDQIEGIFSRLLGWPAGTQLALQPLPAAIEMALFDGKQGPEALFDSLADRLFNAQSPTIQAFLLSSSTFSRMTPVLCDRALHLTNSLHYLTEILDRNLFIAQTTGGLAYHTLFRNYLQRQLRAADHNLFVKHHINAGRWYEAESRLSEAFEHYIIAQQWEYAANIAERVAFSYMATGKVETLLRWKQLLGNTELPTPVLHYVCAMIHRDRYEYDLSLQDADKAAVGFQTQADHRRWVQIVLLKATIDNQRGEFQKAFDQAEPFSQDMSIAPNLRGYAIAIMGTAALYLENFEVALDLLQRALPLWRDTGDQYAVAQLLLTLDVLYMRMGRFSDEVRCLQEVLSIQREFGESVGIAMAFNSLGYEYHRLGEYEEALQTLEEGLRVVSRIPENRAESHLLWTLGDLRRDQGAFDEAAHCYHRALRLMQDKEPYLQASVWISLSVLRRWQGQFDEAMVFAGAAQTLAKKHNLTWEASLAALAQFAVQTKQGHFQYLQSDLEQIIVRWRLRPTPQSVQALSLPIYAALTQGDESAAHMYLKLAVTNVHHPANLQPLIAEIFHTPLLKKFLDTYPQRYEVIHRGLQALERAQSASSNAADHSSHTARTYSLRVSVLGRERIERDGQIVSISEWQAASARELFFYLLFKGASTRDEISLSLWPESSNQQIRQKFHTTLHRIRDAVGSNAITFENDLYALNPDLDIWCDVFEFEAAIKEAQLNAFLIEHTEILWQRAVDLFQGEFLPAFDVDWVTGYREALTQHYLEALVSLANCVRSRGDLKKAVRLLKQALEIDPFREDIHRLLFQDYHTLGDRSRIVRHLIHLKQLFRDELGTVPSRETLILVQSFLN